MEETLFLRGTLRGHSDIVTAIAVSPSGHPTVVSSSRDKSLIVWDLDPIALSADGLIEGESVSESTLLGTPLHRLTGHSDSVQDVMLSSDSMSAVSCSKDGGLRLWDLSTRIAKDGFALYHKDMLSVAFCFDDCKVASASRDGTFKLWDTVGNTYLQKADANNGWFSCVRFFPKLHAPLIISSSRDYTVKVWDLTNCNLRHTMIGHIGDVNDVAVSPDGTLCASGGKYGVALLWDLEEGKHTCAPLTYWLCVATEDGVKIWDLGTRSIMQELKPDQPPNENQMLYCTSLNWSVDGNTLFIGYSDGTIRVWGVTRDYFMQNHQDLAARTDDMDTRLRTDLTADNLENQLHEADGISLDYVDSSESEDICIICQGENDADDFIVLLDCEHMCHSDCIGQWSMQNYLCPKCKEVALSKDGEGWTS